MRAQHVPKINLRYWLGITWASIFGTNMGDFYAHETGFGIGPGLGVLAMLCAIVFAAEYFDHHAQEICYWLVIIIIRTGATNIADYAAGAFPTSEWELNSGLIILLAALAMSQGRSLTRSTADWVNPMPATGVVYWMAMLTAGVLGTVLGDVCQDVFGQGDAAVVLLAALVAVLLWRRNNIGPFYWLVVAVARTTGTAIGDWLAENSYLNMGLTYSTCITGILFVAVLLRWRRELTTNAV